MDWLELKDHLGSDRLPEDADLHCSVNSFGRHWCELLAPLCCSEKQQLQFALLDRLIGAAEPVHLYADPFGITNPIPVIASDLNRKTSLCLENRREAVLHRTQQSLLAGSHQTDGLAGA